MQPNSDDIEMRVVCTDDDENDDDISYFVEILVCKCVALLNIIVFRAVVSFELL